MLCEIDFTLCLMVTIINLTCGVSFCVLYYFLIYIFFLYMRLGGLSFIFSVLVSTKLSRNTTVCTKISQGTENTSLTTLVAFKYSYFLLLLKL